jgi:hypothetical protein
VIDAFLVFKIWSVGLQSLEVAIAKKPPRRADPPVRVGRE